MRSVFCFLVFLPALAAGAAFHDDGTTGPSSPKPEAATASAAESSGADAADAAAAALARLSTLAGQWDGTVEWSGARSDKGTMSVTYSLTGGGSAVLENLGSGGVTMMTTVYHLDGHELRMTHYCAAGNQPRLKARHIDLAHGTIDFDFVDATNLRSAAAPHVHGFTIQFVDDDHLILRFRFLAEGKESVEKITLARRAAAAGSS